MRPRRAPIRNGVCNLIASLPFPLRTSLDPYRGRGCGRRTDWAWRGVRLGSRAGCSSDRGPMTAIVRIAATSSGVISRVSAKSSQSRNPFRSTRWWIMCLAVSAPTRGSCVSSSPFALLISIGKAVCRSIFTSLCGCAAPANFPAATAAPYRFAAPARAILASRAGHHPRRIGWHSLAGVPAVTIPIEARTMPTGVHSGFSADRVTGVIFQGVPDDPPVPAGAHAVQGWQSTGTTEGDGQS
jgi:hypothetical protein